MKYLLFFFLVVLFFANCSPLTDSKNRHSGKQIWTEKERQDLVNELDRTSRDLMLEIENLNLEQWIFQESPDRWSIAQIVEHLTVQNELHYRELSVNAQALELPQYIPVVSEWDDYFIKYATDTIKGKAKWFLEPIGRFCTKKEAIAAFNSARGNLTQLVKNAKEDFRKQFTFRAKIAIDTLSKAKPGQVRDLHQLVLTGIAHTERHLRQIREIKRHKDFPSGY